VERPVPTRAGALLAVALIATGCSGDGDPRVQTTEVVRATVAEVVEAPGTVGARASSAVTAPTDATVDAVLVQDGAQVAKGAVLVRLASPAAQDRLRSAQAAQARASDAAVTLPRADLGPLVDALDANAAASFAAGRAAAAQIPDPERRRQAEQQVADAEAQYRRSSGAARVRSTTRTPARPVSRRRCPRSPAASAHRPPPRSAPHGRPWTR
jgi:multidrug efflux pump subunit AcrA (membrane-fusion protein)